MPGENLMSVHLSIQNVPDDVATRLRERAKRSHRSLEGELLAILEQAAAATPIRLSPGKVLEQVRAMNLETPSESAALLRQDRDGR
jgi:plasmid stability protein